MIGQNYLLAGCLLLLFFFFLFFFSPLPAILVSVSLFPPRRRLVGVLSKCWVGAAFCSIRIPRIAAKLVCAVAATATHVGIILSLFD